MNGRETEIKVKLGSLEDFRARLDRAGFRVLRERVFERNTILDTEDSTLRKQGCLLRVRECGGRTLITFKGQATVSRFKSREEVEFEASDVAATFRIFEAMGYIRRFIYEKYRTEYSHHKGSGIVMVDETPIGEFAEIEGEESWIDDIAASLGIDFSLYITDSYGSLYRKWCAAHGVMESNMVFAAKGQDATR